MFSCECVACANFVMNKAGCECCPIVLTQLASNQTLQAVRCHADACFCGIITNDLNNSYLVCDGHKQM